MVSSSRSVLPTVTDQASAMTLSSASTSFSSALSELRSAADRAKEACGSVLELDAATDIVTTLREETYHLQQAIERGQLRPLPGDIVSITFPPLPTFTFAVSVGDLGLTTTIIFINTFMENCIWVSTNKFKRMQS